ncbi:hypothetical protein BGX29_008122 [Mortierella sp. GBA35]|nr:hypothetical protein BGX29_008122 [Mortierella sp. GBA35]
MINKETAALQKIFEERRKRIAAINKMAWFEDCQREWALAQDIVEPEDASSGGQEQSSGPSSALPPSSVSTPDSTEPSLVADDPPARPTTHAYFTRSKSAPSKITPPNLSQPRIAQGQDHQMEETYADSDGCSSEDMSDDSDSSIKDALAKEWRKYYQSEEYQSRALVYYVEPGAYDPDFPQSLPYSPTHPSTPSQVSTSTKPTSITTTTPVTISKQQPAIRVTNGKAKTTNRSSGAPGASRRSDGSGKSPTMLRSMRNKHSGRKSPPPPTLPPLSSTSSSSSSNTSGQSNYDDNNSNHDRNDDNTSSHDSGDNSDASGEGSIDGNDNHSSHPPPHSRHCGDRQQDMFVRLLCPRASRDGEHRFRGTFPRVGQEPPSGT